MTFSFKVIVAIAFLILMITASCHQPESRSFDWLEGKWSRIEDDSTQLTYEHWKKLDNGRFIGHGFIMQDKDTLWKERMVLFKADNTWIFEVKTPGNKTAVQFQLTNQEKQSFTVENPKHDFPKRISYWLDQGQLMARVGGDQKNIDFKFEQQKSD